MRIVRQILIVFVVALLFAQCEEGGVPSSSGERLTFSHDTITFDTIFTTIGTPTQSFRVINPSGTDIMLDRIELAKAHESGFRINVDGEAGIEFHDVIVPAHDSLYVFVDVNLDENGQNSPFLVQDSVVFYTKTKISDVDLVAWGQDFVMIDNKVIRNEVWTKEKPYLIYNYAFVDSAYSLVIEKGTNIYFHDDAGLFVGGTLKVEGTVDEPVSFKGERNDEFYEDVPDQWDGIVFYSGSEKNEIHNAHIKNANIGLKVGTLEHNGAAELTMTNTVVENMAWAGIWAIKSKIRAVNCQISNARYYNVALLLGGEYEFVHSTIANYYFNLSEGVRTTESLHISNYMIDDKTDTKLVGNLEQATFENCIIAGDRRNELKILSDSNGKMNYLFDHSLLVISDTTNLSNEEYFINPLRSESNDLFNDPYFGDFHLDSLSKAIDYGKESTREIVPFDLQGMERDKFPDLGSYEFVPYVEEEDE